MTAEQKAVVTWFQRMIEAGRHLDNFQEASLAEWMKAGKRRSRWPGWESLIGLPVMARKAQGKMQIERRKTA